MTTKRIDWPATVNTAPKGYTFGAHVSLPNSREGYYIIRDIDGASAIAVQRPDLDEDDAPDDAALDELLGEPVVVVGHVVSEEPTYDDEGRRVAPREYAAGVALDVTIGERTYRIGCQIGAPESMWSTVRAAGGSLRPFLRVWREEGDFDALPRDAWDAVATALYEARERLWAEVQERRA